MLRPRRYCGTMSVSARSTEVYGDKSRCTELAGLNKLDGFNRLRVTLALIGKESSTIIMLNRWIDLRLWGDGTKVSLSQ
ncbi:MAG: hypothetical protein OXC57_10455 [Rhodobacteraceae bacterium]|nr:hypothetical protein [Paracoccaceae bacterium]